MWHERTAHAIMTIMTNLGVYVVYFYFLAEAVSESEGRSSAKTEAEQGRI